MIEYIRKMFREIFSLTRKEDKDLDHAKVFCLRFPLSFVEIIFSPYEVNSLSKSFKIRPVATVKDAIGFTLIQNKDTHTIKIIVNYQ